MEGTTVAQEEPVRYITDGDNSSRSKVICKCDEGYTCVITKTEGPDAGKTYKCSGSCICIIGGIADGDSNLKLKSLEKASVHCECREGWTCAVSKIEGPDSSKTGFECAGDCTCILTTSS